MKKIIIDIGPKKREVNPQIITKLLKAKEVNNMIAIKILTLIICTVLFLALLASLLFM